MRKNKFLLALMVVPCLLASCNKSMNFKDVKVWVEKNYPVTSVTELSTMPIISWEYSNTSGDNALNKAYAVIDSIAEEFKKTEVISDLSQYITEAKGTKSGFLNLVDKTITMTQLTKDNIGDEKSYSDDPKDNVFKVNNDRLSIQYVKSFNKDVYPSLKDITATKIRLYDDKGFCTDYGIKVNKTLDRNNVIKFKFYFKFLYRNDPII